MIDDSYQIIEGPPPVVASKCNNLKKHSWECIGPLYIMQQGDNIIAFQGMQKPIQHNIGSISE